MGDEANSMEQMAMYTGLAHNFLQACQQAHVPAGALSRLADNRRNGHRTLDACVRKLMADYRDEGEEALEEGIITVPDLSAEQLCKLLEAGGMSVDEVVKSWNFYLSTRNRRIGGRGKTYKFKVWTYGGCLKSEKVSEYFSETGYDGHAGAFFTWAMSQRRMVTDNRTYMTIMRDDSECYVEKSRSRNCYPYWNSNYGSNLLDLSVDSPSGFTNGLSFVAFQEWKP